VVEGDNLGVILMLKAGKVVGTEVGTVVNNILIEEKFEHISWSHKKRDCNVLAHVIAHVEIYDSRLWLNNFHSILVDLAAGDVTN